MQHTRFSRLIIGIAAIIVVFWLIGLAIKLTAWLLNLLLPVAAVILIIAVIVSWRERQKSPTLKVTRDTSDTKKSR